jgi:Domain of unknown function (DUF4942)
MFGKDFFPTPPEVIDQMLFGYNVEGKVILEPSAGKGNIVDHVKLLGAKNVVACEIDTDLRTILFNKCNVIADDFLTVTPEQVSHVDMVVMNPPFSKGTEHLIHAWEIAPQGAVIVSLFNNDSIQDYDLVDDEDAPRGYYKKRNQLSRLIQDHGRKEFLGNVFAQAERETNVDICILTLQKPGEIKGGEFEGFFLEEEIEPQANGLITYNFVREIVNRYIGSIKVFDKQLQVGLEMEELTGSFFGSKMAFTMTMDKKQTTREEFRKDLQKSAWKWVFSKFDMDKYTTQGLKADINKFVEKQTTIPFTMKNIYHMVDVIIGTHGSRMDKALLEVFDKVTEHSADNRYHVPGWKTNSHYLIGKKFILPYITDYETRWPSEKVKVRWDASDRIDDMIKAMCHLTGMDYKECSRLSSFVGSIEMEWGQWYSWGFFEIKGYKKGSMHFQFQDEDLWAKFNQNIARIKGYPLFEGKTQTKYQDQQTGRSQQEKANSRQTSSTLF